MTPETLIPATALRLIGAFYCVGSIIGVRMITRYSFIDHAIEAISGKKQPAAERLRETIMLAGLLPVFAGGLALMVLSPLAPWLFALGVAWQAVYLGWLAPRFLDPADDPGAEGRAKTWRAFILYIVCTTLVFGGAFAGLLDGPSGLPAAATGAAATAALGVWGFRALWSPAGKGPAPDEAGGGVDADDGSRISEPADIPVILRPSWRNDPLLDAGTGDEVSYEWQEAFLSEPTRDLLTEFSALFRLHADPHDPRRCALIDPAGEAKIIDGAREVLAALERELGPGRVRFEPLPIPVEPALHAARVRIEPYHMNSTIWSTDDGPDETPRPIYEDEFGLSWSLARDLGDWALDWHEAQGEDAEAPHDPPPHWTDADFAAHEERGRVLAVRIRRELAATGRGGVRVSYATRAGQREADAQRRHTPLRVRRVNRRLSACA